MYGYGGYGELEIAEDMSGLGELELAMDGYGELELAMDGLGELDIDDEDDLDGYGQPWRRRRWRRRRMRGWRRRRRWGRRGSPKRLRRKAKFFHRRAARIRRRIEKAEAAGNEELANMLRKRLARITERRKKMLERSASRGGRRGQAAQHIMDVGQQRQEAMQDEGDMDGFGELELAVDGFGDYYDDDYDGIFEDIQKPGPMRTGIYAIAGAALAHAFHRGGKKQKGQAAIFGAGAGALLAVLMGGQK